MIKDIIKNIELKLEREEVLTDVEQQIQQAYWYGRYTATEDNYKLVDAVKKITRDD
jgi:hypothetical protein